MKSKADRGGGNQKITAVQANIIHVENIGNETKYFDKNRTEHFQLNPHHVYLLPEKPNNIRPDDLKRDKQNKNQNNQEDFGNHFTDDPVEEAFSNEKLGKTLKSVTLVPRQKFQIPVTANQEIGWFVNQLNQHKKVKHHGNTMSEITQFADNYYQMTKVNPFKKQR